MQVHKHILLLTNFKEYHWFKVITWNFQYTVSNRVISPFSFKTKITLNNETPARFALTTYVEIVNKRINFFFKYYNTKFIDPSKFVPEWWFNDLTNVTFHKSPNIVISTHMNDLHTTQKIHIY